MLSSQQVAQLLQQQNAGFMGTAQFASQISSQMPQPFTGPGTIGSYGRNPAPVPPPAMHGPPAFSYGSGMGMVGYGFGNSAAALGTSMVGAGASAGLGLAADAAMWGTGYGAARSAYGAGAGLLGAGVRGLMSAAPIFAAGQAAMFGVGQMVHGAQEQQQIGQALGQFNFSNPNARGGRGFTRSDSMAIGDMVRQVAAIPEMLTNTPELTSLINKMGQLGMMQGVRTATEFNKKFGETLKAAQTIAQQIGSTLEQAVDAMGQSRSVGFRTTHGIAQNIFAGQLTQGLTGMNQQQFGQLQMAGAQTAAQLGGNRAGGAALFARTAMNLGALQRMGALTPDMVHEITGLEGEEGMQALSQQMGSAAYKMSRSRLGRVMAMALGETKDGRFTGGINQEALDEMRESGGLDRHSLISMARKNVRGRRGRMSFRAHEDRITTNMASSAGVEIFAMEMQNLMNRRGFKEDDAVNLVMQRFGLNEEEANVAQAMAKAMPDIQRELAITSSTQARTQAQQQKFNQRFNPEALKKRIITKIAESTTRPLQHIGSEIQNAIGHMTDRFMDEFTGISAQRFDRPTQDLIVKALAGNKEGSAALDRMNEQAGSLSGARDLSGGAGFGKLFVAGAMAPFAETAGERLRGHLKTAGMGNLITRSGNKPEDGVILHHGSAGYESINQDALKVMEATATDLRAGRASKDRGQKMFDVDKGKSISTLGAEMARILHDDRAELKGRSPQEQLDHIQKKLSTEGRAALSKLKRAGISDVEAINQAQHLSGVPKDSKFFASFDAAGFADEISTDKVGGTARFASGRTKAASDLRGIVGDEIVADLEAGGAAAEAAIEEIVRSHGDDKKAMGFLREYKSNALAEEQARFAEALGGSGASIKGVLKDKKFSGKAFKGTEGVQQAIASLAANLSGVDATNAGFKKFFKEGGGQEFGSVIEKIAGVKDKGARREFAKALGPMGSLALQDFEDAVETGFSSKFAKEKAGKTLLQGMATGPRAQQATEAAGQLAKFAEHTVTLGKHVENIGTMLGLGGKK